MRPEFSILRAKQLERALQAFGAVKNSPCSQKGWLRAIREATEISLRELATPGMSRWSALGNCVRMAEVHW